VEIAGFNALKPRFARFERHVKPQLLARERPQAIVLGSSFSEIGFDTNDPALTDGGRLKGYNFAFAGADWLLAQCYFDYALAHTDLKRAVIGFYPGSLPRAECAHRLPEIEGFSELKLLLSRGALQNSLRTVFEQSRARSSHTREGRYLYARGAPGVSTRFREFYQGRARAGCTADRVPASPPPSATFAPAITAAQPDLDLSGLRAVIREARARGIELRLYAYPSHALSLELGFLCGDDGERWAALAAIARVVSEEAPDGSVQVWAFYPYNELTGERVIGREPANWQDPDHFNYELGAVMLADMFGGGSGTFGRRLTADNVEAVRREFLASRDRFLAAHPGFYDDLRATLR
jgi:hypothetical protein